jgi:excisionase family DNA binding protein
MIIEASDSDELRREVNRALGDEPLTVQWAAGYLKVSPRTIRNWIKSGKLPAKHSARGGLEPHFRVLFSAIFHGVSPGISIRMENYGIERKENCSQL